MYAKIRDGYCDNSTTTIDQQGVENCLEIGGIMSSLGWSLSAICGALGNACYESGLNPWRYQRDIVQSMASAQTWGLGYGLFQYSPCGSYIYDSRAQALPTYAPNFSDRVGNSSDGIAQVIYADRYYWWNPHPSTSPYNITFDEYKQLETNTDTTTEIFFYHFERSSDLDSLDTRKEYARKIYVDIFHGEPPKPYHPKKRGLPVWVYTISSARYKVQRRLY